MDRYDPAILDWKESVKLAGNNETLAHDLLTMMLHDFPLLMTQLECIYQSNETDDLTEIVHKMYGSTAYCAVTALREATQALEISTRANDMTNIYLHFQHVREQYQRLIDTYIRE